MRYLTVVLSALLLGVPRAASAGSPAPAAGSALVYAITEASGTPPTTSIHLQEVTSRASRVLYRDASDEDHILIKIAASDVLRSARTVPPRDVYLMIGEASVAEADLAVAGDALCQLHIADGEEEQAPPEPILVIPLCFSDASPYGLWNRAPILAVSSDAERVALSVLRAGEIRFERPAIRVLGSDGSEEWRIVLDQEGLYVADLAWSPDGKSLAYTVMPQADEHTLDEALLPRAGVYLADIEARTTRLLHRCYAEALAWGPKPNRLTVAVRPGDIWAGTRLVRVLSLPSGRRIEEFSVHGQASALAYSDDGEWLAVQTERDGRQQVWLYPAAGSWGRLSYELSEEGSRLSLLGWARVSTPES